MPQRLLEAYTVHDVLADGVGRVEVLPNGLVRWLFYSERTDGAGDIESVIVASIVMSAEAIPEGRAITDQALADAQRRRRVAGSH
jgi:hypothetical protein